VQLGPRGSAVAKDLGRASQDGAGGCQQHPGINFTKLRFGRKVFGQFIKKKHIKIQPKITDKNLLSRKRRN
jgi:hypothetical protein